MTDSTKYGCLSKAWVSGNSVHWQVASKCFSGRATTRAAPSPAGGWGGVSSDQECRVQAPRPSHPACSSLPRTDEGLPPVPSSLCAACALRTLCMLGSAGLPFVQACKYKGSIDSVLWDILVSLTPPVLETQGFHHTIATYVVSCISRTGGGDYA